MTENLVVRLQVAVDSIRRLVESLDPDDQGNDVRISELNVFIFTQVLMMSINLIGK